MLRGSRYQLATKWEVLFANTFTQIDFESFFQFCDRAQQLERNSRLYMQLSFLLTLKRNCMFNLKTSSTRNSGNIWRIISNDSWMIISFSSSGQTMIWKKLYRTFNALHPNIKYTMDKSKSNLPFLDTMVIHKGCRIQTDIFYKPTASKQY